LQCFEQWTLEDEVTFPAPVMGVWREKRARREKNLQAIQKKKDRAPAIMCPLTTTGKIWEKKKKERLRKIQVKSICASRERQVADELDEGETSNNE